MIGVEVRGKLERSKVAAVDGRTGTFFIISRETPQYGPAGVDKADEVASRIDLLSLTTKRGSWYDLEDGTSHNGRGALKTYLREHPDVMDDYLAKAIATQASLVQPEHEVQFLAEVDDE